MTVNQASMPFLIDEHLDYFATILHFYCATVISNIFDKELKVVCVRVCVREHASAHVHIHVPRVCACACLCVFLVIMLVYLRQ